MNKRREAFLSRNTLIKRFTKNTIIKNFGVSEKEFDQLIQEGFIEQNNHDICISCYRTWDHKNDECEYCGEEEHTKETGYYSYKL